MSALKTWAIASTTLLSLTITACQKTPTEQKLSADPSALEVKTISVGYQKASVNLVIAQQQKLLEQQFPNATIKWNEFPGGPQILEALAVGSIDIGATGDTPPVYAQAGGKPLHYVAYEAAKPESSAILVPKDSALNSLADLKGKRVAVHRGSSSHYLLVQAVTQAGLNWNDIDVVWLSPADARAAFQKGAVDAWAIWDPYYAAAEVEDHAKVLASGKGLSANYTFYLASAKFLENHPSAVTGIIQQVNAADAWVQQHIPETAEIFAKTTGLAPEVSLKFIQRRPNPSGAEPLNQQVINNQQQLADRFSALNIIPKPISIQDAVWTNQ